MVEVNAPQWDLVEFEPICLALQTRFGCSKEEAIFRLQSLWTIPEGTPPTPPLPPPPTETAPHIPPNPIEASEDYDLETTIADTTPHTPLKWAVDKIKARDYVQLWYFTMEGILDAKKTPLVLADDTLGLLKTDSGFTLQHVKTAKPSRNAVEDKSLRWEQIMSACHNLCEAAADWPDKFKRSLATFFLNLKALKATGSNPCALILYQATARKTWHQALKGVGKLFNLSNINQALLTEMENQIRDKDHKDLRIQVSNLTNQASILFQPHEPSTY
jgi:hypothetical protein